jgi:hypothetical protein
VMASNPIRTAAKSCKAYLSCTLKFYHKDFGGHSRISAPPYPTTSLGLRSGPHNLRRRSNCNLCACSFPPCATRSPSVRRR